ncbi:hypothetical protein BDR03DRAFT_969423 [Suillus americanus]|nr:hypothetical protein BDR03DRAFT_969423 [Suillus americanus]
MRYLLNLLTFLARLHMVSLLRKAQMPTVPIPSLRRVLNCSTWPAQEQRRSALSTVHTCVLFAFTSHFDLPSISSAYLVPAHPFAPDQSFSIYNRQMCISHVPHFANADNRDAHSLTHSLTHSLVLLFKWPLSLSLMP